MAITTQTIGGTTYPTGPSDMTPPAGPVKKGRAADLEEPYEENAFDDGVDRGDGDALSTGAAQKSRPTDLEELYEEDAFDDDADSGDDGAPSAGSAKNGRATDLDELHEESAFGDGAGSGNGGDGDDGASDDEGSNVIIDSRPLVIENLPLPGWAKKCLKKWLSPDNGNARPSSVDAAKTVNDFQKQNRTGLLSIEQMQQMANTGYCTLSGGKIIQAPPEVRNAARKFMENDGALFKKMEAVINGKPDSLTSRADHRESLKDGGIGKPGTPGSPAHDGVRCNDFYKFVMNGTLSANRPAEYAAAKTINEFQKQYHIESLSFKQLVKIADTGYCKLPEGKVIHVRLEVQVAAQKFVANDGALYKRLESTVISGFRQQDAQKVDLHGVCCKDFHKQVMNGTLSANYPAEYAAAKTINEFQKQYRIDVLSFKQMQQMAEAGYCNLPNGKIIQVPPEIQAAAQKFMTNDGALFKKLESTVIGDFSQSEAQEVATNESDGQHNMSEHSAQHGVCYKDFYKQVMNGILSANQPAEYAAAKTINEFQKQYRIDVLSFKQMQQMAEAGYCNLPNGKIIQVPPEIQAAAQKFMANDGALFKKLESVVTGNSEGLLKTGDDDESNGNGSPSNTNDEDTQDDYGGGLPSPTDAAKVIYNFQQQYNLGLLSFKQMQQIAETGHCTLPNGQTVQVSPEVQEAARKFMANDGALLKKLEAAVKDNHGGTLSREDYQVAVKDETSGQPRRNLPSSADAARIIYDFQKKNNIDALSLDQVKQIAETTGRHILYFHMHIVFPTEARDAARKLLERDAALWRRMESAASGKCDGLLTPADYEAAIKKGIIGRPTIRTIYDFRSNIGLASFAQVEEIAETGQCTLPNGQVIQFLPEIQTVARKLLENFV